MNQQLIQMITGQKVLFITTKNLDYIRNSQEIALLEKHAASVTVIGSFSSSYPMRLFTVWLRLLFSSFRPYTVVFAGFSPQLIVPFFSWKIGKCVLIEDFFISLYDTLVCDRQKFKAEGLVGRFLHRLDTVTIRRADLVISDTRAHGSYFSDEFGKSADAIEPLYLEADTSIYYPRPAKPHDGFHVLYFGSVLPLQGLQIILDAIDLLKDHKELVFTVVGPLSDSMRKPEGENIRYINWLPQDKLAEAIAQADLCLAGHFHPTIQKAQRTIPGKAYIYQAMEKPMILGDNPATRELEGRWTVPVFYVPMGDSRALAGCILEQSAKNVHRQAHNDSKKE